MNKLLVPLKRFSGVIIRPGSHADLLVVIWMIFDLIQSYKMVTGKVQFVSELNRADSYYPPELLKPQYILYLE